MSWTVGKFTSKEFACKCGCGLDKVSPTFLWKLNLARSYTPFPWIVASGCRCEQHNKDAGGAEDSDHLCKPACEGVDIKVTNSWVRDKIVNAAYDAGFRRRGLAKTFIHLGDRANNPQGIFWMY